MIASSYYRQCGDRADLYAKFSGRVFQSEDQFIVIFVEGDRNDLAGDPQLI
jgi:hypothetical protein